MTTLGDENHVILDTFCLDRINECLLRGAEVIKLRPKAFAVLNQLVGHPGQLVTKEQLLNTVWPETFVGDAVLKVTIRQLRDALGDDPKAPEFIETAHRRGYRFIGQIAECGQPPTTDQQIRSVSTLSRPRSFGVVGRDEALARLQRCLQRVIRGERQVIFVTGEAGIGKTALIDAFVQNLEADDTIRIGSGQCLEQYGTSEAYLPVLDAIGRLCREQPQALDVLRAHAPMWLLQMPSLVSAAEREALSRVVSGATRERMLREMVEALAALSQEQPLVLLLEDLHWSDYSTLDLISYLARLRQPAQLMVIGTLRQSELIVRGHPLKAVKHDLLVKQLCRELPLEYLSTAEVAEYLAIRFPGNQFPPELASLIHDRTEGNPLFMINAVDYLVREGAIVDAGAGWVLATEIEKIEVGVPDGIRQMIEKQIERLDPKEQRVLEAASVVGAEFSSLAVVAALGAERSAIEICCDELARRGDFIRDLGVEELPNGEPATRYGFIHALYQNALYARLPVARRAQFHRGIAERGEEVYGERAREIATELAMHFEHARDYKRAAKYLQRAAETAIRRFAYQESIGLARRGLKLLEKLPDTDERAQQELCLQLTLGVPLIVTGGYASEDVGIAYTRARELCQRVGATPDISEALWGLWAFYMVRAELKTAREIAEEFLQLGEHLPYPGLAMRGHEAMEVTFVQMGNFAGSIEHFEKALLLYDPQQHRDDAFLYSQNPGVALRSHAAWALWFVGKPDQALKLMDDALLLARELSEPHGLAHTLYFAAVLHHMRRDQQLAQQHAEAAIEVSTEHGLSIYKAFGIIARGSALVEQGFHNEGIEQIREGLAVHEATGARLARPHFLALLAAALQKSQQVDESLRVVHEALDLSRERGEERSLAELYRLKGELLLTRDGPTNSDAIDCFNEAIKVAQRQKAKSWELRAATSLARVDRDKLPLLSEIYNSFTEGFDTKDLQEARALLTVAGIFSRG
ncbi:MAG TPA: AAA family ATPase [Pyrinomonadaceae bacterium]|jgi:DNA-binding winged helix-turn-helix (wHTH) protein/predicted ATPase|nr:AAA family ATPase [Pyrinomonadaceae bacterium]